MSISYELAKRLKDAGFPQHKSLFCYEDDSDEVYVITRIEADREGKEWSDSCPDIPTLSELIDACGEGDFRLDKSSVRSVQIWHATSLTLEGNLHQRLGSTPEDAVANLWLTLNKNK